MTQEALKLALEALECALSDHRPYIVQCKEAITAIKEALAQEQEPVANYCKECLTYNGHHEGCSHYTTPPQRTEQEPVAYSGNSTAGREADVKPTGFFFQIPKRSEPSGKPSAWVGLTDEEIAQGWKESWVTEQAWQSAVWWAEDKLRNKNT